MMDTMFIYAYHNYTNAIATEIQDFLHASIEALEDAMSKDANNQSASGNDPNKKTFLGSKGGKEETCLEEEQKAPSDQLSVFEKKFLLCSERGDVPAVRALIEKHKDNPRFNINCRDAVGRTSLIVAIENENMELIDLLLTNKVQAGDALLHAISEEYVEAVEVLLQHEEKTYTPGKPYSWEAVDHDMATFTKDITPLILAAHRDNYEIIKLLLDRGASLPMPHNVRCGCDECDMAVREDCLRHSRSRINAYRALTSPSLICLSSADPIQTAFNLSRELARLSSAENEFKLDYMELRHKCEEYATNLLDHTRTSYELEVMLNYDPNGPAYVKGEVMKLERLKLAILCNQKSFVAHPNVQQLLASVWYAGSPGFRRKNFVGQLQDIAKMGMMCPMHCMAYMVAPHSEMGQTMKKPFTKFITHSTAYCFFLMLLIAASQRVEQLLLEFLEWYLDWKHGLLPVSDRGKVPGFVESGIIFFVFGFVWAEIKEIWEGGVDAYINDMWNVVDYFTNMLYITFMGLRACSWYIVQTELAAGQDPFYPKQHWDPYDPMLISEGIFGAANIFSFLKMVHIFSVNPHLGPLQISLGRMVFDIIKFFFIYTLVLFAFGCGMNQLLWYYADMEKNNCYSMDDGSQNPNAEQACLIWRRFANLFETSQSLFWASFGLVELENFELAGIKSFTRFWSLLMFGSYSVINVVVLLNLLIAMMSNSYQIISERSDVEWKFARSKLWMSYFEDGSTVPPPFNIIPTPKFFMKMLTCSRESESSSIKVKEAAERDSKYRTVMRCLIRRYVTSQQRKAEDQGVTEDDVNEVKQAVTSFRSELFDILRNNGMKGVVSTADTLSRKERLRERRLLKDFNIDLVESIMEAFMKDTTQTGSRSQTGFGLIRKMTGKRQNAKKNWNQIVGAARSKQNPIGTTYHAQSGSLKELREKVLREQELPPMKGARRFAHAARRVLQGEYAYSEIIEEEPGGYSASATPRSSIPHDEKEETRKKDLRRKSTDTSAKVGAGKGPAPSTTKEQKKIETTPKKEVAKRDVSPKKDTSPKRDVSPKRDSSPKPGKQPSTTKEAKKMETTPKRTMPKKPTDSAAKAEPGKDQKKMETTPKKTVPRKHPDSAAKLEPGKEHATREQKTTPKKALPRKAPDSAAKRDASPKGEPGKTTPKKVLPRKPPDSAAKRDASPTGAREQKTTPKKILPRKPPDSTARVEAGKKMETTPKKMMPRKPTDSTTKVDLGKEPTTSVKELKKELTKKEAPRKPLESAAAVGKLPTTVISKYEKQQEQPLPSTSIDRPVRKASPTRTLDEALKSRRSSDVVLDIETDTSQDKRKLSPRHTQVKASEIPSDSQPSVKGLISTFDQKPATSSKTDPVASLAKSPAKSPARKTSAKVFPTEDPDSITFL